MPLIEEKFDQSKIDSIKRYLQREAEKGRKKDYEIIVDGFKVVSRTDNMEEFEDYEQEIKNDTRNISILVFDGTATNRNTRYSFLLRGEPAQQGKSLNGLGEIDQMIQEKLDAKDKEYELKQLQEKLSETQTALEEAEEYNDQLEKTIAELKDKRLLQSNNMGEVLNALLSSVVQKHAAKIPGGQALAGLLGVDDTGKSPELPEPYEETAASFEKKQPDNGMDEMTRNRMALIADFQQRLDEPQLVGLFAVIEHLTRHPEGIPIVIDLLNDKNQKR